MNQCSSRIRLVHRTNCDRDVIAASASLNECDVPFPVIWVQAVWSGNGCCPAVGRRAVTVSVDQFSDAELWELRFVRGAEGAASAGDIFLKFVLVPAGSGLSYLSEEAGHQLILNMENNSVLSDMGQLFEKLDVDGKRTHFHVGLGVCRLVDSEIQQPEETTTEIDSSLLNAATECLNEVSELRNSFLSNPSIDSILAQQMDDVARIMEKLIIFVCKAESDRNVSSNSNEIMGGSAGHPMSTRFSSDFACTEEKKKRAAKLHRAPSQFHPMLLSLYPTSLRSDVADGLASENQQDEKFNSFFESSDFGSGIVNVGHDAFNIINDEKPSGHIGSRVKENMTGDSKVRHENRWSWKESFDIGAQKGEAEDKMASVENRPITEDPMAKNDANFFVDETIKERNEVSFSCEDIWPPTLLSPDEIVRAPEGIDKNISEDSENAIAGFVTNVLQPDDF